MKVEDFLLIVYGRTNVDIVSENGLVVHKIKYDTYYEEEIPLGQHRVKAEKESY